MRDARSSVTVRIAGEEHVLKSAAEPEYTSQCAQFLDDQVTALRRVARLPDTHRAIVLAALSVVDQHFRTVAELEALRAEVAGRATALAERLEQNAGGTDPTS
ncbi:MAG: cell division protein ZapA [Gammaproteobacteria bacterium]|nr:cell division protein ZapA [Gammaproteobacteria bacterium]